MSYIEGFVIPVPTGKKQAYRDMAAKAVPLFKEYGATRLVEAWGDDVPEGKVTDFQGAVKAQPDETIVFSWIEWPSKEVRDEGSRRMQEDPRMKMIGDMPFDSQRMILGGFELLLDTGEMHR
ncbi:MAG TPA: DUF1428 domain-containing protein [Kofleriaceae bacterium]|jgi:uncharacterized protein YbaA (DUF1428 family)|nr:DUF1428 domain-containing protein [Kofleriaceae bacterium]